MGKRKALLTMFVWLVVSTLQASEYLFTPINSAFDNIDEELKLEKVK